MGPGGPRGPAPIVLDNLEPVRLLLGATLAVGVLLLVVVLGRRSPSATLRPQA